MPNFVKIGGVTRKPLVDLTRNDPMSIGSYRTLEGVMKSGNIVSDVGPFIINVTFPLLQFVVYVVKFTASDFH